MAFLSWPELPEGARRITLDGVAVVRFGGGELGEAVADMAILASEDLVTLSCQFDQWERDIGEGCDLVIETLSQHRLSAAGQYRPS